MGGGGGSVPATTAATTTSTVKEIEPIKSAEESMKQAHSETSRAQKLRHGLAGAFSRSTVSGGSSSSSATSGSAKVLGG